MKKRVFIPISIGFILLNILFWGLTILGTSYLLLDVLKVVDLKLEWNYLEYILCTLGIMFLLYTSIRFLLALKIHLRKEDIATFGDMLPKFEKIQYKCLVKYTEIKNISIIASEKNSLNKNIQLKFVSSAMPKKYFAFELINGKTKRICIQYYNKRQVVKMLNYISQNMKNSGNENTLNIDEIMKDWYTYGGYNREDLKLKRGEKIHKKQDKTTKDKE